MNAGESCIANIGPRERQKRLVFGVIALFLSVVISAIFVIEGVRPIWRLALNRVLGLTVVMVTHELESILKVGKTCIMLDKESKSIIARGSPAELKATSREPKVRQFFQRQARAVYVKAFVSATILTAIAMLN